MGTNFLGSASQSPYSIVVSNLVEGRFQLNAKAPFLDNPLNFLSAPPIWITVGKTNNNPPTVWLRQALFDGFYLPSVVRLDAEASDTDGYITQVEFYVRTFLFTNLLGTVRSPPFTLIWSNSTPTNSGFFFARATDNLGTTIESRDEGIGFTLTQPPNNQPVIDVVQPSENAEFRLRSPILFQARARYIDNNINPVIFYAGTSLVGSVLDPPYFLLASNVPPGRQTLSAVVKDLQGNEGSGLTRTITVKGVQLESLKWTFAKGFEFDAEFYPSGLLTLQVTTNLIDWIPLSTNRVNGSAFHFVDPASTNATQRYYRVLLEP